MSYTTWVAGDFLGVAKEQLKFDAASASPGSLPFSDTAPSYGHPVFGSLDPPKMIRFEFVMGSNVVATKNDLR